MKIIGEAPARVARLLLEQGPATVAALSEVLNLTPAAVRKHLDVLEAADLVSSHEAAPYGPVQIAPTGKGRPAKYFALTERGRVRFVPATNRISEAAVEFIAERLGENGVREFAETVFKDVAQNVTNVSEAIDHLHTAGYFPTVEDAPNGVQISMRNCPMGKLSAAHRGFCEVEAKLLGERIGANVVQISTIASGADICTLLVANPNPRRSA